MPAPAKTLDTKTQIHTAPLIALSRLAHSLTLHRKTSHTKQSDIRRSAFQGRGMEYDESRIYQPGDDMRHIDWRVTARTGSAHTKVFREERERALFLCVDIRRSMRFATQNKFKSVIAAECAAILAWIATHEGDKVGGLVLHDLGNSEVKPARGRNGPLQLIRHLSQDFVGTHVEKNNICIALSSLIRIVRAGSIVFIISDLHDLNDEATAQIVQLGRRAELFIIHVVDPLEEALPPPGHYTVGNGDEELSFYSGDKQFADTYQTKSQNFYQQLRVITQRQRAQLLRCYTHTDPIVTMRNVFGK